MLILTRRVGEKLIIDVNGEIIEVIPLGIKGNQVKIGVQADKSVVVHREEIWNKIKQEKNEQK